MAVAGPDRCGGSSPQRHALWSRRCASGAGLRPAIRVSGGRRRALAMVTMSGTTPWFSKPQKCVPVRPKPVCTSSAMHRPPASRTVCRAHGRSGWQHSRPAHQPTLCMRCSRWSTPTDGGHRLHRPGQRAASGTAASRRIAVTEAELHQGCRSRLRRNETPRAALASGRCGPARPPLEQRCMLAGLPGGQAGGLRRGVRVG